MKATISKNRLIQKSMGLLLIVMLLVLAAPASAQSGGGYELSATVIGSGGQSTGGSYRVRATISQPEAGVMSGGDYELLGGFLQGEAPQIVDFRLFARFADWWFEEGSNLPADLHPDNVINFLDVVEFGDKWLDYRPLSWPLK